MRELLNRLRRWLIRKLGGYDEQKVVTIRTQYTAFQKEPTPMRVEVRAPECTIYEMGRRAFYEYLQRRMAEEISQAILRSGAVSIKSREDEMTAEIVYRGTVYLYLPGDIELYTGGSWS